MTSRFLPIVIASTVMLGSGLVHGVWTQRWQTSSTLVNAAACLADVPLLAGDWSGTQEEVDPEPFQQARAVSYWSRRYTNDKTREPMSVILMCGRADHMSLHTPDVCYRGAGFAMVGEQTHVTLPSSNGRPAAEFWTARFRQSGKTAGQQLRIYWTWSAGGTWRAPASPRWTFGGEAFLYKLYVAHDIATDVDPDNTAIEFLKQLMPVLDKSLNCTPASAPGF